jgi:hypothetical protein
MGSRRLPGTEVERGLAVRNLGHHALPRRMSSSERPTSSTRPGGCAAMAGAGQHGIAEPAQARQRIGPAAHRRGQPRDLDQAAGDERGSSRYGRGRGFRRHRRQSRRRSERAADLDAGDVVRRAQRSDGPRNPLDEARRFG